MDPDVTGGEEEVGIVEGGERVIRIDYVRKKSTLNKRKKNDCPSPITVPTILFPPRLSAKVMRICWGFISNLNNDLEAARI